MTNTTQQNKIYKVQTDDKHNLHNHNFNSRLQKTCKMFNTNIGFCLKGKELNLTLLHLNATFIK